MNGVRLDARCEIHCGFVKEVHQMWVWDDVLRHMSLFWVCPECASHIKNGHYTCNFEVREASP